MTTQRSSAARRPIMFAIAAGATGAALALGALWASGEITSPANAQEPPTAGQGGDFKLTVGQLRINQRISQAAVRRSNESLNLLDPLRGTGLKGWRTQDLRDGLITGPKVADGAITGPKIGAGAVSTDKIDTGAVTTGKIAGAAVTGAQLAPGSVGGANLTADLANQLPLWAVLNPGATIVRGRGAVSAEQLSTGNYRVVFERDVSRCSFTATHNLSVGFVYAYGNPSDPNVVRVTTSTYANPATPANAWVTVQVLC